MARKKITKDQVLIATKNTGGIISAIAERLGVSWNTAKKYTEKWEETRQAIRDEEEMILDMAETALYSKVRDNDYASIRYLLSTKGRNRGYVTRQEFTGKDGDSIDIDFTT